MELQKAWKLLKDELTGLQISVPTGSLGLVKFLSEVFRNNASMVEEVEVLEEMVIN